MLIPIDDDVVPDGYEPVRFGMPNIGEQYFANGDIAVATVSLSPRLIVRKTWQPPAWLKPGWIAMDANGDWWWTASRPNFLQGSWIESNDEGMFGLCPPYVDFAPPPCTDPSQSLREIKGPQQ